MSKEDRKIWLINEQGQKFFIYETEKCDMEKELNETIQRLQNKNETNKKRIEELEVRLEDILKDNYVPKMKVEKIIQKLDIDIERNKRRKIEHNAEDDIYSNVSVAYEPETVKRVLEDLLKEDEEEL